MTRDLFARYDVPVPRYTSYPPVPHWTGAPDAAAWRASLDAACAPADASLALYAHVPFCESLCTFCGCNTVITRNHRHEEPYVDLLLRELDLYLETVPSLGAVPLRQLHLGGGTPTFLSPGVIGRLGRGLRSRFAASDEAFEASLEADPRVTSEAHLEALAACGFNRISFGVQDVDPEVQRLVNRLQPAALTRALCDNARALGFESINVDLIYGLPGQTPQSMHALADEVLALAPDRLAVYGFARVPWIKPAQRKFTDEQVPAGAAKRALAETIRGRLLEAGYVEIGLDHYALPSDGLARAAGAGTLHRNFMGYADTRTSALLGIGVSAISETAGCYHQNEKVLPVYERRVADGEIPTHRGHQLSPLEQRHRSQILALMTTFRASVSAGEAADARAYLATLAGDGLVEIAAGEIRVTERGRPFLRNIAAFFDDAYRSTRPSGPVFSTAI